MSMSTQQETEGRAAALSAVIEEEDLYANSNFLDNGTDGSGGTASQTPTEDSNSRRSSQVSETYFPDANVLASTVPKKSQQRRQLDPGSSSGVRQLVEKRRSKAHGLVSAAASALAPTSKDDKRSIFTLDHVRKIFGSSQHEQQQQQHSGSNSRRSSQVSEASGGNGSEEFEMTQRRLSQLRVDTLPAVFLAKYLGLAPASGLFGVDCIRRPADDLVKAAGKRRAKTGRPLPIAQLTVLQQGVSVRPHPQSEGGKVERAFHPIGSISYAAMDPQMRRIFCLVALPEAEAAQQAHPKPECHAFLCNSVDTAHRLVLAVTFAFESASSAAAAAPSGGRRTTPQDDDLDDDQRVV